ncbi:MAG: metallopeptidase TldD-related protein [Myxococcota bacterium]|nr:metallopeptidase TldD-related protein [Myxococcota bacterium]
MIPLLLSLSALAAPPTAESQQLLLGVMEEELARATSELHLPDESPPWWLSYEVVDGEVTTVYADFGAVMARETRPHRVLRVESRAGDSSFDSANFAAFGEPGGVLSAHLPHEDDPVALGRELWLATDIAYKQSVEQLSRKVAELPPGDQSEEKPPAMYPVTPTVDLDAQPFTIDAPGLEERITHLSGVLAEYPQLESGVAAGSDWQGVRLLVNSEGTKLATETGYVVIRVEAVYKHSDGSRLRNGRSWVARHAGELPPIEQMEAEVREMADWLVALEDAPVLKEYLGPVLFDDAASVELYRQLAAAEFVGTPPEAEGRGMFGEAPIARATARVGRRLMPAGWRVVDTPDTPGAAGRYTYDHEGVPGQEVELVEDGVVRRVLMSRIPADVDGESTGHGRGLGSSRREAMPSNVRVEPKRSRRLKALERKGLRMAQQTGNEGLLVIRRIEPPAVTEDFDVTFMGDGPGAGLTRPYEAYLLLPDGTQQPVRGLQFSGVDRRVLRDAVMAGETADYVGVMDGPPGSERFYIGPVGGLPGAWAVPPVLISELELDGSSGGDQRVLARPE